MSWWEFWRLCRTNMIYWWYHHSVKWFDESEVIQVFILSVKRGWLILTLTGIANDSVGFGVLCSASRTAKGWTSCQFDWHFMQMTWTNISLVYGSLKIIIVHLKMYTSHILYWQSAFCGAGNPWQETNILKLLRKWGYWLH